MPAYRGRTAPPATAAPGGRRRETDEEAYEYAAISIESDGDFSGDNVTAATKEAAYLQETVFADWRVELLHGRMKAAEKDEVMARFRANETQVLVATTVIEVGVDVPNATVMIVADADRFGLAQLHQLRGRVGRGEKPAQVFLLSASKSEASLARLAGYGAHRRRLRAGEIRLVAAPRGRYPGKSPKRGQAC